MRFLWPAAILFTLTLTACEDGPTAAEAALNRDLKTVREVTAPFQSIDAALAAGFSKLTGCDSHPQLGAQGYHYAKLDRIDGTVTLREPEVLMYEPRPDGSLRLVGVEYIVPPSAWSGAGPPSLLGQDFHMSQKYGVWALHVWVWQENPSGMFADWNPKVSCQFAPAE